MLNSFREPKLVWMRPGELPVPELSPDNLRTALAAAYLEGCPPLPVVARREGAGYSVIFAQQSLAAAREAGLRRVPVVLLPGGLWGSVMAFYISSMAQSRDPFKGAQLLTECLAYAEKKRTAELLGLSLAAVTQRLRLLQLPVESRIKASAANLSEAHLLEIVKLPAALRNEGLDRVITKDLSLTATRELVRTKLEFDTLKAKGRRRMVVKDGRIFQNTIRRSVEVMQEAGLDASCQREQGDGYIEYRIRVPESQLITGSRRS